LYLDLMPYSGPMPLWMEIVGAVVVAAVVWKLGGLALRSVSGAGAHVHTRQPDEAEDVGELDVYLVCGECGTEYKVTQLGELQVPRHCGEPMRVVQGPAREHY
jgi:hypothetical protein